MEKEPYLKPLGEFDGKTMMNLPARTHPLQVITPVQASQKSAASTVSNPQHTVVCHFHRLRNNQRLTHPLMSSPRLQYCV